MIVINVIGLSLVLLSSFVYTYVYPKKKVNLSVLLLLLSILPIMSIWRKGTYESGDLSLQTSAILSMYNSIVDGNLIPRWGAELYYEYGSPYHLVMYFLSRYVIAIFHALGIPILESVKLYLTATFILSGISMYQYMKYKFGEMPGFVSAIFYLFAPYHFVTMHFRVEPGEMAIFVLMPLIFLATEKIVSKRNVLWTLAGSVLLACLILSHQALALLFFPFIVMYSILLIIPLKKFKIKTSILFLTSWSIGVLLTSFYIFPVMLEGGKYTITSLVFKGHIVSFQYTWEYFFSPYRYGLLYQGPRGELSFALGYMHWMIIILACIFLVLKKVKKKARRFLIINLCFFIVMFFLMTPLSKVVWETVPILNYSHNTYRLLVLLIFFVSLIAGSLSLFMGKRILFAICITTILLSILNWGNRGMVPTINSDEYFHSHVKSFLSEGRGSGFDLPIWVDKNKSYYDAPYKNPIEIINGSGEFRQTERNTTHHQYIAHIKEPSIIRENTFYFPGWNVYLNGKKIPINYQQKDIPGIITFTVPAGLHKIDVNFESTRPRIIGDIISLFALITVALVFLHAFLRRYLRKLFI